MIYNNHINPDASDGIVDGQGRARVPVSEVSGGKDLNGPENPTSNRPAD